MSKDNVLAQSAQKRPQNCGTGFCSCIECVMEAAQKPVGRADHSSLAMKKFTRDDTEHGPHYYLASEVDAALAQPPLPVQEPDELTIAYMSGLYDGKKKRPWVGLTHQETKDCMQAWDGNDAYVLCRAIEAKLKEKNT
jgi:hypothetical protein